MPSRVPFFVKHPHAGQALLSFSRIEWLQLMQSFGIILPQIGQNLAFEGTKPEQSQPVSMKSPIQKIQGCHQKFPLIGSLHLSPSSLQFRHPYFSPFVLYFQISS